MSTRLTFAIQSRCRFGRLCLTGKISSLLDSRQKRRAVHSRLFPTWDFCTLYDDSTLRTEIFELTHTLSGFQIKNDGTMIIQNETVPRLFHISFIIWILLKKINCYFLSFSRKFVVMMFVKILYFHDGVIQRHNYDLYSGLKK